MGEEGRGRRERKVSLLQLAPFFASIFPLFPQKRLILRLRMICCGAVVTQITLTSPHVISVLELKVVKAY